MAGTSKAYTANQILFRCALTDANSLYEIYGTNSTYDQYGAREVPDVVSAYYTYVKNVAIRFTNLKTGSYFTGNWQSRKLTSDDWVQDDTYIYIPASAFSDVNVEVFKTAGTSYYTNSATRYVYSGNNIIQAMITLRGPGVETAADGSNLGSNHPYWYSFYPMGYNLNGVTFVRGGFCKVSDYPNVVFLPAISTNELSSQGASQASFSVSIECESEAVSSTSTSTTSSANVAMGFFVNQANALSQAQALGLVTSSGGLTWLLDNNYGRGGNEASGVGIKIYNRSGSAMNLLPDLSSTGGGNLRGWYAYKDVTSQTSSGSTNIFTGDFTASLEALSGQTITAGTVNAQLQVVVSFQ